MGTPAHQSNVIPPLMCPRFTRMNEKRALFMQISLSDFTTGHVEIYYLYFVFAANSITRNESCKK